MKKIVLLSIVLNLGLLGAVGYLVKNRPSPKVSPTTDEARAKENAGSKEVAAPAATPALLPEEETFSWRKVESEDYKQYIENLKAIGCPEKTIRDIIRADVKKLYAAKFAELQPQQKKLPYWKMDSTMFRGPDPETIKKRQELSNEKVALLKQLLGPNGVEASDMNPWEGMVSMGNDMDYLPAEKQTKIAQLQARQQAKIMKLFSGGSPDQEDMKEMQAIQRQTEKEIESLLSPQELQQYQVRNSPTAQSLKYMMREVDLSEQEYLSLFNSRKPFEAAMNGGIDWTDEKARTEWQQNNQKMEEDMKRILGDNRYKEYQRGQDMAYQAAKQVADNLKLPEGTAIKVYDIKKLTEESFQKVQLDASLSPEDRKKTLEDMYFQSEASMKEVMGEKGWESMKKNPNNFWMRQLKSQAGIRP